MASRRDSRRSEAGKTLAALGAKKGGKARANTLTPQERSEIARRAVRARWEKAGKVYSEDSPKPKREKEKPTSAAPTMPYSMFRGPLTIGDVTFECHVLNDLQRVLTQREVVRVITGGTDSSNLARYLRRLPREPDLSDRTITFKIPGSAQIATGYDALLLVEICDMYLEARDNDGLKPSQEALARSAETVLRACAKVGIIALIDEATGYQEVRAKQALQIKLQAFIADELQEWASMFPPEFWFELARLEGIRYSPRNRPLRWGKYVMAFVYDAIDKDVANKLREINPNPHYKQNHHQWLRHGGREKVNNQIQRVIAIMQLCDDIDDFKRKFAKVFSKGPLQLALPDFE